MASSKPKLDSPARWKISEQFEDAVLWGAFHGVFNFKEDARARAAFAENKLDIVKKITAQRIKTVGSKPKFKKLPVNKRGYKASTVKGSRAYAYAIYETKLFPSKKKAKPKSKIKKAKKNKEPIVREKRELSPPNPHLPQNRAYVHAQKNIKPGEILLYIYGGDEKFTAVYYHKKTKNKRNTKIKLGPSKMVINNRGNTPLSAVKAAQKHILIAEKLRRKLWDRAEGYRKPGEIIWSILPDPKGNMVVVYRKGTKRRAKILSLDTKSRS